MDVRVGLWRKLSTEKLMLLNYGVGKDSWESLGLQGDTTSPSYRRSLLGVHWKDWCWSWNSNTLATWCEELTRWKRPWCWEGLGAGEEGDNRRCDGWMASPTRWAWVWVNSGSWWWTGRPGVLRFMGSQSRTRLSDWTELNWTLNCREGNGNPLQYSCLENPRDREACWAAVYRVAQGRTQLKRLSSSNIQLLKWKTSKTDKNNNKIKY